MGLLAELGPGKCPNPFEQPLPEKPAAPSPLPNLPQAPDFCKSLPERLHEGIQSIGSERFCDQIADLERWLEDAGNRIDKFLDNTGDMKSYIGGLKIQQPPVAAGPISAALAFVWNKLIDSVGPAEDTLHKNLFDGARNAIDVYRCLFQRYSPAALVGIVAIRGAISSVRHIRFGTDALVWLTTDIDIVLDLLDELLQKLQRYFAPLEIPEVTDVTRAWMLDRITTKQRDCLWRMHGFDPATYETFASVDMEQLDWREEIQYLRRQGQPDGVQRRALRERGWITEENVDAAMEMYWELPSINDHLHWLQRQVFDAAYVAKYRLMEGFDDKFWPAFGHDLTALGMREEYAKFHYAAHWIMPSPEQMKTFLYRSDEIQLLTGQGFTLDDYKRLLAEQDYNIAAREWFVATAYAVPAISYVKEWYSQNIINRAELEGYHRRLGFNPHDAERFADIDDLQKIRRRRSAYHGWTPAATSKAYVTGQLTADQHTAIYRQMGYTEEESIEAQQVAEQNLQATIVTRARSRVLSQVLSTVRQGIATGIMGQAQAAVALQAVGWPDTMAQGLAGLESALARTATVKQAVSYIRRHYLDGSLDLPTAQQELVKLGVVPEAVARYITVWQLQLTPGRKRRTAQQVVNDLATNQLDRAGAVARLRNLGYGDDDTRLYLADAVAKMQKLQAARIKADQKAGAARTKELAKLAKEMDTARKSVVKAMMKDEPVAKLEKWLKLGIRGTDYFRNRMTLYGYSPDSIQRRIDEICQGKGANCQDTAPGSEPVTPASATGPTTGGPGGNGSVGVQH